SLLGKKLDNIIDVPAEKVKIELFLLGSAEVTSCLADRSRNTLSLYPKDARPYSEFTFFLNRSEIGVGVMLAFLKLYTSGTTKPPVLPNTFICAVRRVESSVRAAIPASKFISILSESFLLYDNLRS